MDFSQNQPTKTKNPVAKTGNWIGTQNIHSGPKAQLFQGPKSVGPSAASNPSTHRLRNWLLSQGGATISRRGLASGVGDMGMAIKTEITRFHFLRKKRRM